MAAATHNAARAVDERLRLAARNNAEWCDTVCRAHGRSGAFRDAVWLTFHTTPTFYPNAVTLSTGPETEAQLAAIRELVAANIPGAWAVKDSFRALDLTALGFRPLFEAEWVFRPPGPFERDEASAAERWATLHSADELAAWEAAWRGDAGLPEGPRIFPPALIDQPDIAVIAGYRGRQIIAGAMANQQAGAIGLSNVFGPERKGGSSRAGCMAHALAQFPGLPIVGYETAEKRPQLAALGFQPLGPLRVWQRAAQGSGPA